MKEIKLIFLILKTGILIAVSIIVILFLIFVLPQLMPYDGLLIS